MFRQCSTAVTLRRCVHRGGGTCEYIFSYIITENVEFYYYTSRAVLLISKKKKNNSIIQSINSRTLIHDDDCPLRLRMLRNNFH